MSRSRGGLRYRPRVQARRQRRAYRSALAEVPWYREEWSRALAAGHERPPAPAGTVDREAFRFFPVAEPLRPAEDPGAAWAGDALLECLRWPVGGLTGRTVFECRPAWHDPRPLAPWRRVAVHAVIDPPAAEDPGGPAAALRRRALGRLDNARRAVVVGDPRQLAAIAGSGEATGLLRRRCARLVERIDLDLLAAPAPAAAPGVPVGGWYVVHDRQLGYVGGGAPDCGRLHVAWRSLAVRNHEAGVVLTRLGRGRPRLVDVLPAWAGWYQAQVCPRHGSPVLVPTARPAAPTPAPRDTGSCSAA